MIPSCVTRQGPWITSEPKTRHDNTYLLRLDDTLPLGLALRRLDSQGHADDVAKEHSRANRSRVLGHQQLDDLGEGVVELTEDAPDANVDLVADTVGTGGFCRHGARLGRVGDGSEGQDEVVELGGSGKLVTARLLQCAQERQHERELGDDGECASSGRLGQLCHSSSQRPHARLGRRGLLGLGGSPLDELVAELERRLLALVTRNERHEHARVQLNRLDIAARRQRRQQLFQQTGDLCWSRSCVPVSTRALQLNLHSSLT